MNWAALTTGGWLLRSAAGGGLLLLLVWLLMSRVRQPARRQRLGEGGVAAALLLAALSLAPAWFVIALPLPLPDAAGVSGPPAAAAERPPAETNGPPAGPAEPEEVELEGEEFPVNGLAAREPTEAGAARPADPDAKSPDAAEPGPKEKLGAFWSLARARWPAWLAAAYALGVALLLGRWLLAHLALWWLLRQARPAPPRVARLFDEMAVDLPGARLRVSRGLRVPASCGVLRPTVVLPAALCHRADAATLRWVFAHELTHLERRDAWSCLLFAVGQAFYFYLPWFWWLQRQVRLCQEYVADAAAAGREEQRADYAQFLLGLTGAPAAPAGAAGVSGPASDLFRRIRVLLQAPLAVEQRCPRPWSLAAAGSLVALAVLASGVGLRADAEPVPAAEPPVMPPAALTPEPAPEEAPAPVVFARPFAVAFAPLAPEPGMFLARMPADLTPEQLEYLRKQLEKSRLQARDAFQQQAWRPAPAEAAGVIFARRLRPEEARLGARLDRPGDVLTEQLGLEPDRGLLVAQVLPGSPAARAGLKANDILLELDGKDVPADAGAFARLVLAIKADTEVAAVVLRKGKREAVRGLTLPEVRPVVRVVPPMAVVYGEAAPGQLARVAVPGVPVPSGFLIQDRDGPVVIRLRGHADAGRVRLAEILVADGVVALEYGRLADVPEPYRVRIHRLVEKSPLGPNGSAGLTVAPD